MLASLASTGRQHDFCPFSPQSQEKYFTNYTILSRLKLIATPGYHGVIFFLAGALLWLKDFHYRVRPPDQVIFFHSNLDDGIVAQPDKILPFAGVWSGSLGSG